MGIEAPAEVKYEIIHAAVSGNCLLNISALCKMAGVSRSGYYHWISQESYRKACEERDRNDFDLILTAFRHRGYKKGARSIYMTLLRNTPPVIMNIKKIRRLMKKYGLKCPFRDPNPYKQMAKATEESTVAPNLVKREFRKHGPRKVLLTDITYLFFWNEKCYLSVIKDAYTKEVLAYVVSMTMVDDIVKDTLEQLMEKHGSKLTKETIIHSDQGSQYKSRKVSDFLKDHELQRSMSRKANCWDNAPQESFFGHMKDEIDLNECAVNVRTLSLLSMITWTTIIRNVTSGIWRNWHPPSITDTVLLAIILWRVSANRQAGALPRTPRFNAFRELSDMALS